MYKLFADWMRSRKKQEVAKGLGMIGKEQGQVGHSPNQDFFFLEAGAWPIWKLKQKI